MALTREQILQVEDLEREEVEVPEWGGSVIVRAMTAEERDAFEQSMIERKGKKVDVNLKNARARLVALTVVDEEGNRLFTDADIAALGRKSSAPITRISDVARRLSGLDEEEIEEMVGN